MQDHAKQARDCFKEMQHEGILQLDAVTYVWILKACATIRAADKGKQMHDEIAGYAQGHAKQALDCFEEMQREGILPNAVTYLCILKACATIGAADKGKMRLQRRGCCRTTVCWAML